MLASPVAQAVDANIDELELTARELVAAIRARDDQTLLTFLESPSNHSRNGKLEPTITEFLFDGTAIRKYWAENAKSPAELLALGDPHIVMRPTDEKEAIVFFVAPQFAEEAGAGDPFYRSNFMRKYFACRFDKTAYGWKMKYSFCYAETEGPFPN